MTAESIADSSVVAPEKTAQYALGLGDDALVLAHRLGEWIANAPELEEDVALGNIGLDLLGHARSLLTYAGTAWDKSEDDLAYFRDEDEFRSHQLFEQVNGDFAATIARQLIASLYFVGLYRALSASTDATLSAIAAKALKEVDYHVDHSVQWTRRLGLGTDYSHERMQEGLLTMWPFVDELFREDRYADGLAGIAVDPRTLRAAFESEIARIVADAGLELPTVPPARGGGRSGVHAEAFGTMLAEMQVLARAHPGATW
ncbi:MAG TPA: 1,2-phenylacetyl-CoA epoxidase subunit PaaC [Galbitalea sp.]|nr:1,2-phenylacetyl-CoA epoxidase subunit PaaC [Galbitalea sp.]